MQFHRFLDALDMGQCQDQQQREALFDIALLFVAVDGVIEQSEVDAIHQWLDTISWTGEMGRHQYYEAAQSKCLQAIRNNETEDFLRHRAKQLIDNSLKQQAVVLAETIANADGELDARELQALNILRDCLN